MIRLVGMHIHSQIGVILLIHSGCRRLVLRVQGIAPSRRGDEMEPLAEGYYPC
jgi:hypothetical protein